MRSSVKEINKNQSWGLTLGLNPNKYSVLVIFLFRSLLATIVVLGGATAATAGMVINPVSLQAAMKVEQQASEALSNAEKVVIMARDINDAEAVSVATEAVQIASDALNKARKRRHDLEKIVHAIKKRRAGNETGTVSAMQGDVYIRTSAGDLKINRSFILQQGDEIVTASNASLEFILQGDSKISLESDSSFTATQMKGDYFFSLAFGKFKAWVKRASGSRLFYVSTTMAQGAVRGTEFEVEATASGTSFTVHSGVVEVTPTGGKAVMVNAGWRFHVDSSGQGELEMVGGVSFLTPNANTTRMQGIT